MKITCAVFVLLIQTLHCMDLDETAFAVENKATGFCFHNAYDFCHPIRWTSGDRLLLGHWTNKCFGSQGKSVGSEVGLYDCDENSDLQKWECKNGTLLALKGQELYIELIADSRPVLSRTIGPKNHLTIMGSSNGVCTKSYTEYFTTGGNANGRPCMFPFMYKNQWFSSCTAADSSENRLWCSTQTKFEHEIWGYCPTNSRTHWNKHVTTGDYYQLNTQSALTWDQAEAHCKQQVASLLSITDPHQQAYVMALLTAENSGQGFGQLWTGMVQSPEHGWQWSNGKPYRYLNWDSGHPHPTPGQSCGVIDGSVQYSWQSSTCDKKLGYICYSEGAVATPAPPKKGYCSPHWVPYNGHCFYLNRTQKTWTDAQKECRKQGAELVSIRNVEDQSFVISQIGYAPTDELWIGLNDRKTERLFDWSDHSTVSFTSWELGKPSVFTDEEDCVLIRGENGNWADRVCTEKHGYICMKTSASEPSGDEVEQNVGCKAGWKRHGSYCYFAGVELKTFDEAKADCKSADSSLVDVSNRVDNAFLVSLVGLRPEKYFWLGLSNMKNHETFSWTNSKTVTFTHWNAEMPGHEQGCVAMTTGTFAGLWDVLPCTNKEKYICKHLAEGVVLTPAPPTAAPPNCTEGWTRIPSTHFCAKYFEEPNKRTWYEANNYCKAIGGDLLSIHSLSEQQIKHTGTDKAWIGLRAPDPVTGFVWSDRSPVNFQHWENKEPNKFNNSQRCAVFNTQRRSKAGSWSATHCESYNNWLCQIRAGQTPKPPPEPVAPHYNITSDGWIEWNGYQYYINTWLKAMEDARHYCQQRHGDLVSINSELESIFLQTKIAENDHRHWIGLKVDLDLSYEWTDGSQVVFQNWNRDQPKFKNYDENCAAMNFYTGGFWHSYNCGREFKSICKRSGSHPANSTAAPPEALKGGCPNHWKKINSKCYRIINNQKLPWDEAKKQCQDLGGDLASIPSRHEEVFLISQVAETTTTDLWIGFRSDNHRIFDIKFYWTDGSPNKYVNLDYEKAPRFNQQYWYQSTDLSHYERYLIQRHQWCAVFSAKPSLSIGKWIPKACNETNGFICSRNVDPALPDSPEPTTADYVKVFNDSFKVVTRQMNWDEARKNCEHDGATLVSLRSMWSQAHVELLALNYKAPLWIGLNKPNGYFRYVDGWHMTFSHWGSDEPSSDRNCTYVDVDGKWKTEDCKKTMNSVCMKSTDVPPTESSIFPGVCPEDPYVSNTGQSYDWIPFKGHCYKFFTEQERWSAAAANCKRHGASLASIEDPSEQEFIYSIVEEFKDTAGIFWIGLFRSHKGEWLWLDKTVMDYTHWGKDQPHQHTSRFSHGQISALDGTWKTGYPNIRESYICKTPKVLPPKPTTPPSVGVLVLEHPGHVALVTVFVIAVIAMGAGTALILFKKFARGLPVPGKFTTFDNPLFFSNVQSQPDVCDTTELVENAGEEENPEPIIIV